MAHSLALAQLPKTYSAAAQLFTIGRRRILRLAKHWPWPWPWQA
ncbi:hypothetical protein [Streptomyces hypolithicus]